jgi:hypothetical protein
MAMAVAAAMLGASLWPSHALRGALFVLALICVGGSFVNLIVDRKRSRYDLNELRRIQEKAELREIDVPQPIEFDSVRCASCGEVYRLGLPVCPHCSKSQFG